MANKTKMKSKKGTAKRFSITAKGRVKFRKAKRNHILSKKNSKMLRKARGVHHLAQADEKSVVKMLPYA